MVGVDQPGSAALGGELGQRDRHGVQSEVAASQVRSDALPYGAEVDVLPTPAFRGNHSDHTSGVVQHDRPSAKKPGQFGPHQTRLSTNRQVNVATRPANDRVPDDPAHQIGRGVPGRKVLPRAVTRFGNCDGLTVAVSSTSTGGLIRERLTLSPDDHLRRLLVRVRLHRNKLLVTLEVVHVEDTVEVVDFMFQDLRHEALGPQADQAGISV